MNHGFWPGLVLLVYIPITLFLFARFSPAKAAAMSLLGAAMFLPEHAAFDPPVLPPFDKRSIPAVVAAFILYRQLPKRALATPIRFLLTLAVIDTFGAIGTLLTNQETYVVGAVKPVVLPGLTVRDLPGLVTGDFAYYFLPFFIGAVTVTSLDTARVALRVLAKAGLLYSLFCLFEVRMSPNLHLWVYGYAAHQDFLQTLRWGGYRPTVFFFHGLVAAFFMLLTTIAAATCVRARIGLGLLGNWALPYLMVVLVLCKSTGAIAYATMFLPLIFVTKPKTQLLACFSLALVVLTVPYTRTAGLFPTEQLVEWASSISADRAQSLLFRFVNEDRVLEKLYAFDKVWFGWGGFGRYFTFDPWTGRETSIVDGQWLILIGARGLTGLFVVVGLLVWPVWKAWKNRRVIQWGRGGVVVGGLAIMVTIGAIEMIPNAPNIGVQFWLAGALYGLVVSQEHRRHPAYASRPAA